MRKLLPFAVLLLFALRPTFAQEILQLGQLTGGELTAETPTASYFVAVESGKALHLQAVAATPGLTVQATLNTAAGTLIQSIPNPNNSPSLEADLTPSVDGILRLDISSASGTTGKFVLLLQEITPPEPDAELSMIQPTIGTLQPDATIVYALTGDPESRLILHVTTTDPLNSLEVQLLSAGGAVIASLETQASGSDLLIPAQSADYQVRLDNVGQTANSYEITLQALDRLISTPVPSLTIAPTIPVTLAATEPLFCTVTPLNVAVNIRRGPSTQFAAFATLQPGAAMIAVARNPEGTWYQVDTGAGLGWVALSVAAALGPCGSLQVVYIPTPTFSPPTETPTEMPPTQPASTALPPPQCSPREFTQLMDNGAYMVISLPRGNVGDTIFFRDGYHTQYVFPTCRAILWSSLNFTCRSGSRAVTLWTMSENAVFDWNATCGSNTNSEQTGLSFGVQ